MKTCSSVHYAPLSLTNLQQEIFEKPLYPILRLSMVFMATPSCIVGAVSCLHVHRCRSCSFKIRRPGRRSHRPVRSNIELLA